jgi:hypothetical protein
MVEEKESPAHVYVEPHKEAGSHDSTTSNDDGILLEDDKRASAERRLVKKLDRRLLPTVVVIYIMNYIDVRQLTLGSVICVLMDRDVANSRNICQAWWT